MGDDTLRLWHRGGQSQHHAADLRRQVACLRRPGALNPWAQIQIKQYAKSVTELFKLMLERREADLADRVWAAREGVFGWKRDEEGEQGGDRAPILLSGTCWTSSVSASAASPASTARGTRRAPTVT